MKRVSELPIPDLLASYEHNFEEIKSILNALSHEKRLQILLSLLTGDKSFRELKKETNLEKTALAHHLNQMIAIQLIFKPAYNTYSLHIDGERFLRVFEEAFQQTDLKLTKDKERMETRQFSIKFAKYFFGYDKGTE